MTIMNYDLKQKANNIVSILEKKSEISSQEKHEDFIYGINHFFDELFFTKTEHEMRTLGRGSPEVDGSRYYFREKKFMQSKIPELSVKLEQIANENNSQEKFSIIEKSCNTKNLYGLIGVIELLHRKYSKETDKPYLKEISKYEMHTPETVICMMMTESGQANRIVELSKQGLD